MFHTTWWQWLIRFFVFFSLSLFFFFFFVCVGSCILYSFTIWHEILSLLFTLLKIFQLNGINKVWYKFLNDCESFIHLAAVTGGNALCECSKNVYEFSWPHCTLCLKIFKTSVMCSLASKKENEKTSNVLVLPWTLQLILSSLLFLNLQTCGVIWVFARLIHSFWEWSTNAI
jgi:hypothetical protein